MSETQFLGLILIKLLSLVLLQLSAWVKVKNYTFVEVFWETDV